MSLTNLTIQQIAPYLPVDEKTLEALAAYVTSHYVDVPEIVYHNILPSGATAAKAVCNHGSKTDLIPRKEGELPIYNNAVLRMEQKVTVTGTVTVDLLLGLCEECGRVHWSLIAPARKEEA